METSKCSQDGDFKMLQSFEMETWEAHELQSLRAFIGVSELESVSF